MSALWVDKTFYFGDIAITTYRNAQPSIEWMGGGGDERSGHPMDAADLSAAVDKYRELLAAWHENDSHLTETD